VSRRLSNPLYCGAAGRITLHKARALGRAFVVTPKVDGAYCTARVAPDGALSHLWMRNGLELPKNLMAEFRGIKWTPGLYVVEAEVYTERANRLAATRGWRTLHVFDVLRIGDQQDVSGLPYAARRDALMRAETAAIDAHSEPWTLDEQRRAHDRKSGKFVPAVPTGWRRMRVVESRPAHLAEQAWIDWVERGDAEGLVVIATEARIGQRSAKRKLKTATSIDATVVSAGHPKYVGLDWGGVRWIQYWTRAGELRPGNVVEVACDGFNERTNQPKHGRIVRPRPDLGLRSLDA
jgi:hypothetical protein